MQIFYFWETKKGASFPGYLGLCIDSWRRNVPDAEVICVNHSNLAQYCGGRADVERLKIFSLPLQSDIVAVAVLAERPGIFLDADTVILPGFDPSGYEAAWLTMYGNAKAEEGGHATNFFYVSRPKNPVLLQWLKEANRRIALQNQPFARWRWWLRRNLRGKPARVGWNYLGNQILDPLLRDKDFSAAIDLRDSAECGYVQTEHFIGAYPHIGSYRDLWFDPLIDEGEVFARARDHAVCLQHSWTPPEFCALDREAVLRHPSLKARVLRAALGA
ncbi:MAG: hypothetical protein O7I42_08135 [Alphaproteobacteria bacterium]|nr:hypothetical protein [Alphaproteobacteria bacterium]